MPRRVKFHPSVMGGEPNDGDSWNEGATEERDEDWEDNDRADTIVRRSGKPTEPSDEDDRFARMEAEVARLREENSLIKRAIPPAEPLPQPAAAGYDGMDDEEFDALLFSNPKEALRLHGLKIKDELRNEYVTNQGTSKFWDQFYQANGDLADDDDLVQSTLQKNMDELGNMPVDKAKKRLAELTRDRILGFIKKTKTGSGSKRAVAEGASAPLAPAAPVDDTPKPGTLSALLRTRRERHRTKAQAA